MNDKELQKLKRELQTHSEALARLEGKQAALLEQMQERFGIGTLAEAEAECEHLKAELDKATEELDAALDQLAEHGGEDESDATE